MYIFTFICLLLVDLRIISTYTLLLLPVCMPAMSPCPQSVLVSPHCVCLHSTSVRHRLNTEDEELRSAVPGLRPAPRPPRPLALTGYWGGGGAGYTDNMSCRQYLCRLAPLHTCRTFCHTCHLSETGQYCQYLLQPTATHMPRILSYSSLIWNRQHILSYMSHVILQQSRLRKIYWL